MSSIEEATIDGPRPGGWMGVDRLVLVLVMLAGSLSLVSYRWHFFVRNYDTFVVGQVIPSLGIEDWLGKSFGYKASAYDTKTRATLGSPYFPEYESEDGRDVNATASDYLGLWFYTREIVDGKNPYAIKEPTQFTTHAKHGPFRTQEARLVQDPSVPDQFVGILSYPPFGPLLVMPFFLRNYFASYALFLLVVHLFLAALGALLVKASPGYRLPVSFLLVTMYLASYPLGFLTDRGNIEGVVLILVGTGLLVYGRGYHMLSALLLGMAAAGKVVPAIFFCLFLLDGRFRALAVALVTVVAANLIAMLFMHTPIDTLFPQILSNMEAAKGEVMTGFFSDRANHSFFGAVRSTAFLSLSSGRAWYVWSISTRFYSTMIFGATVVILFSLRGASFTNRALVFSVMMLAFPYHSADYKLIHLYIPFGLILLGVVRKGWASTAEVASLVILTLVFAPKSYQFGPYGIDYLINGSLLAALVLIGLRAKLGGLESGRINASAASSDLADDIRASPDPSGVKSTPGLTPQHPG